MRGMLSFTAASASPTSVVLGSEAGEISTSTSTDLASIPNSEYVKSFASIKQARRMRSGRREQTHPQSILERSGRGSKWIAREKREEAVEGQVT